ncbi:hypothetical protein [Rhodovulum sp. YEN HP10]
MKHAGKAAETETQAEIKADYLSFVGEIRYYWSHLGPIKPEIYF